MKFPLKLTVLATLFVVLLILVFILEIAALASFFLFTTPIICFIAYSEVKQWYKYEEFKKTNNTFKNNTFKD